MSLIAQTPFAELERPIVIAVVLGFTVFVLSLLIAYFLPHSRSRSSPRGTFVPLMFAAMFVLLPLSLLLLRSNLLNSSVVLIVTYTLVVLPCCVWQLRCSINRISPGIEDTARIDGCSPGQFFRNVVLPIIGSSIVVTLCWSLLAAWSLLVIVPSISQIPSDAALWRESAGFDPAVVGIAVGPLVVLFLFLSIYLVRRTKTNS